MSKSFYPLPITAICAYHISPSDLAKEDIGNRGSARYYEQIKKEYSEFIDAHSFVIFVENINEGIMFTL